MWRCPHCKTEHDSGSYPDHWRDGNRFEFECPCGATFDVDVDWSPQFHVIGDSMKVPA